MLFIQDAYLDKIIVLLNSSCMWSIRTLNIYHSVHYVNPFTLFDVQTYYLHCIN